MTRRIYKFTDKKHTRAGIASSVLGVAALLLLNIGISMAYRSAGNAGSFVGLWGVFSLLGAAAGFVLGIRGFREEDVYYLFAQIGVVLNSILFIIWMLIFIVGM